MKFSISTCFKTGLLLICLMTTMACSRIKYMDPSNKEGSELNEESPIGDVESLDPIALPAPGRPVPGQPAPGEPAPGQPEPAQPAPQPPGSPQPTPQPIPQPPVLPLEFKVETSDAQPIGIHLFDAQTSGVTTILKVSAIAGKPEPVYFALPQGYPGTFSPAYCVPNPICMTFLSFGPSPAAQAVPYTVPVTGFTLDRHVQLNIDYHVR